MSADLSTRTIVRTSAPTGALERLASWCYRRRRSVVVLWIASLVLATVLAGVLGGEHRADYSMPGSESAAVRSLLQERFPESSGDPVYVVARADSGLDDPSVVGRLAGLRSDLATMDHVAVVGSVLPAPDGRTALVPVTLDDRAEAVPVEAVEALIERTAAAGGDGLQTELGGWPVQYAEQGSTPAQEGIGLVAALAHPAACVRLPLAAGNPDHAGARRPRVWDRASPCWSHNVVDIPEWGSPCSRR
jgi:putative drug exporter of the RND superfamily